jgi:uncharacterized protein (DUF2141 family)
VSPDQNEKENMAHPKPVPQLSRAVVATVLMIFAQGVFAADLVVTVANIQDGSGQVLVGLFDSDAAFPKQALQGRSVPAIQRDADGSLKISFAGLPAGTYAVSAIHDKDMNGKLTTNLLGIPTEPYGFSGQGSGRFGPPAYPDVSFRVPEGGTAVTIQIK